MYPNILPISQRIAVFLAICACFWPSAAVRAQIPYVPSKTVDETRTTIFADSRETADFANFRLQLSYDSAKEATIRVHPEFAVRLPAGARVLDLTYEHTVGNPAIVSAYLDGKPAVEAHEIANSAAGSTFQSDDAALSCSADFTVAATFQTTGNGTLFSKCAPTGKWSPNAKALFLRGGRLVYDIGWVGAVQGGPKANDGKPHRVVLVCKNDGAEIFLDGKRIAGKKEFAAEDVEGHVFKIGRAAPNFGHDFKGGTIQNLRYWSRSIDGAERKALLAGRLDEANTPDLNWSAKPPVETFGGLGHPGITTKLKLEAGDDFKIANAWVQPLEIADHAALIAGWDAETLQQGRQIYQTLCVTCHGTPEKEGSLPTAPKFHLTPLKNGSDPYRMYQTMTKGFGLMVPQPQYNTAQKYAVIQFIRESYLKSNPAEPFFEVDDAYLASLPKGLETVEETTLTTPAGDKQYEKMDFGPALMWTYQVNNGTSPETWNIAQKGIAVRLDSRADWQSAPSNEKRPLPIGATSISKGRAWMIYDEDTMRVAAAYSGAQFIDWRGIAFDGSHGTHAKIAGTPTFVTPDAPAWKSPQGDWEDSRIVGRDGRKFGPLPRDWVQYKGLSYHSSQVVIHYTVGKAKILESPSVIEYGTAPVFVRTLNIDKSPHDLWMKLPQEVNLSLKVEEAAAGLTLGGGTRVLVIPAIATPAKFSIYLSNVDQASLDGLAAAGGNLDLEPLTKGGPPRFGQTIVKTEGALGDESGPFAVDTIAVPNASQNPWESWMRLGGFDFFPDNPDRAAVCTWLGDVWLVDGVAGDLQELKWRRICSGLFQPLGLKIVDGRIYVTCRDQIARLHDLNGDEEIDFVECFNNDHQVTEHFHEFAMGLQTDDAGNFYYAKSARHALTALVPHHGTLLRVSPDGTKTEIVANGFRAANGVCLNPDGTWIVTDQEGHWNPKNRINYVREGGFYGNMFGYHDVTDESNDAMEQPLCWITNAFDRSPAELLWVPKDAGWGGLDGTLLNLSYGYGMIYTVPHEIVAGQAQGGMCAFPIPRLPTGIHRGRFHPTNRQLYVAGMFAWAGSQKEDGGFFRIRATGKPAYLPTKVSAQQGGYTITFSDPLPTGKSEFAVKTWDLKRTASYGSKHYNEKELKVTNAEVRGAAVTLTIPEIKPTWGMEIRCKLANGEERIIHSSIHRVGG